MAGVAPVSSIELSANALQKESSGFKLPISALRHRLPACLAISKSPPEITLMTNTPLWLAIGSNACGDLHLSRLHPTLDLQHHSDVEARADSVLAPCCIHHSGARKFGCLLNPRSTRPSTAGRHGRPATGTTRPILGTFDLTPIKTPPLVPEHQISSASQGALSSAPEPKFNRASSTFPEQAARRARHGRAGLL